MTANQALEIADQLAHPDAPGVPSTQPWWPQSLAHGVPGIALLHIELAAAGMRPWQRVQDWLAVAVRTPVTVGAGSSGPFYGAPALAHTLACADRVRTGSYRTALAKLDARIASDTRGRVETAHARIASGDLPALAEFGTLRGLAGIGAYLLHRHPTGPTLRAILQYLVELTRPITDATETLPGWWSPTGPTGQQEDDFPGGHANFGLAHGISGPLALLATALRHDIAVSGQREAITALCTWIDHWRTPTSTTWPYLLRRCELTNGTQPHPTPRPPSWCYGTAGQARTHQIAALATGDTQRQHMAENALIAALSEPNLRAVTTDASLCHGYAGLARIAARAATDAKQPTSERLAELGRDLMQHAYTPTDPGLLEGTTGVALSALTSTGVPPTGWDTCLLIA